MKKHKYKIAPYLAITLCAVELLSMGGLIGFTVGSISDVTNDVPIESYVLSTVEERMESEPIESIPTTPSPETTEHKLVYYDCPLSHDIQDYIRELCDENGVPMSLVIAMIEVESSFDASAVSGTNDYGLMQINSINHEWLSVKYGITDFLDPYQNVLCGISIISEHYANYQDVDMALMAYNMGASGASRLWDDGIYETSYSRTIRNRMEVYENEI